jgi:hypothetical protein
LTNVNLTADADIINNNLVMAGGNAALNAGNDIDNAGSVQAGGDATLTAGRTINTSGTVAAGDHAILTSGTNSALAPGNIVQTAGLIAAAGPGRAGISSISLTALTGPISQASSATISATNATAGDLALTASGSITANGTVTAAGAVTGTPSVALTANGGAIDQAPGGIISATNPTASTISLTAATGIAFGGVIATSGPPGAPGSSISMVATAGDIIETAPGAAGPSGVVKTSQLIGSAGGNALFNTAAGNQVVQLGPFSTGAGNFTLIDSESLTVTGSLSATGGSAAITTLIGTDPFGNPTLGNLTINPSAPITASQNVALSSQHNIANYDTVVAAGHVTFSAAQDITDTTVTAGNNVVMSAGGSISQNTGTVSAGNTISLAASTGTITDQGVIRSTTVSLNAAGGILISGLLGASGSANLLSGGSMDDEGAISGTTVNLNAGADITITGLLAASGAANLMSGGSISETGQNNETGTLVAYLLTGSTAGDALLNPASYSNQVTQLGNFTAGGTLSLNDGAALTITGPVTARTIDVGTSVNTLTLADQAVITTGGVRRPTGALTSFPPDALTTQGAYFTTSGGFIQIGTSTILGIGGGPSVLRIDAKGSANITFDPLAGLQGKTTWLILDIFNGTAKGQIHVENLDVIPRGPSGSANLTGSVSGLTSSSAAGASDIEPSPNPVFQINSCPIHSVSCVLLPSESVPTANPLNSIDIGTLTNPNEDEDLLLPIVSDQDY